MAGGGQERPANHSRPERVRNPNAGAKVKQLQFARASRRRMNRAPSAGHEMHNGEQSHQCSADVDRGLHDIGPDYGCQSAFEGIDHRQRSDNGDRCHLAGAQRNRHHNGHCIDAHAFRRRPGQKK